MTVDRTPLVEALTVGRYIVTRATARGLTRKQLATSVGLCEGMVYHWQRGTAMPSLTQAETLAETLNDDRILSMVRRARNRRCARASCGRPFTRSGSSRRMYCSDACKQYIRSHPDDRADPRQDAIDAFCRSCEPEGICRQAECPLRAFSPFVYVPMSRSA